MKSCLYRNFALALLLSITLNACNSTVFNQSKTKPIIWVSAKASPIAHKKRQAKYVGKAENRSSDKPTEENLVNLESPNGNLWERITKDFQIPLPQVNSAIQEQINWFQQHQDYLNRTTQRATPYMYMVYEEVQKRNLPAEVVLLPIIESAYYPLAYSGAGAAGLWQLMPGTANKFGLKRNWWYDGRRDIFASTSAALDYLVYLQNYFNGNWLLALAAYDAGEGTVQAAIRRNELAGKDTDFWSLDLPQETKTYVPRLLALAVIIKNPGAYNISMPAINDQPYLGKVDVGSQIKLADAAKLADMSLAELKQLNPGYSRWTTVPNGPSHLLLPLEKIRSFKEKLSTLPRVRKTSWGRYKIQRGDTIEKIAQHYNTSSLLIKRVNRLKKGHPLPIGKLILVPAVSHTIETVDGNPNSENSSTESTQLSSDSIPETASDKTPNKVSAKIKETSLVSEKIADTETELSSAPSKNTKEITHIIKSGETLSSIAQQYRVGTKKIIILNKLKPQKPLKIGTKIKIPSSHNQTTTSQPSKGKAAKNSTHYYTVHKGDNLARIAKKTGVPINTLKKLNHVSSNMLKPGMKLALPSAS